LLSTAVLSQFYHSVGLIEQTVENTDSLAEGKWHISQGGNPLDKDTFFKGESSHLSVFERSSVSMETKQGGGDRNVSMETKQGGEIERS